MQGMNVRSPEKFRMQSAPNEKRVLEADQADVIKNHIRKKIISIHESEVQINNREGTYFVTFSLQGWVDVFTRNHYKDILIESLGYCQKNKGLEIFAWCIMTNHMHFLARSTDQESFSDILRDFKKFTSKAVIKAIQENERESRKEWLLEQFAGEKGYRFWRSDNKPIEVWSNKVIKEKMDYIHYNPVEEGLVFRPEDYVYSSAVDYAGQNGLLGITLLR